MAVRHAENSALAWTTLEAARAIPQLERDDMYLAGQPNFLAFNYQQNFIKLNVLSQDNALRMITGRKGS